MSVPRKIDMLPDSIISKIFLLLVANQFYDTIDYAFENPRTWVPWNYAAVCRRWRIIALDDPRIWTFIRIAEHKSACTAEWLRLRHVRPRAKEWIAICTSGLDLVRCFLKLKRSKELSLRIDTCGGMMGTCHSLRSMLRACVLQGHRWQSLTFDYGDVGAGGLNELIFEGKTFSQLQSLECRGLQLNLLPLLTLHSLSSLHTLTLTALTLGLDALASFHFPWHHLHTLTLSCIGGDGVFTTKLVKLLRRTSNLVDLTINIDNIHADNDDAHLAPARVVDLPNLERLEITKPTNIHHLLPHIHTPQLRSISWPTISSPESYQALIQLIDRSKCKVTHFHSVGTVLGTETSWNLDLLTGAYTCIPPLYQALTHLETLAFTQYLCKRMSAIRWTDAFLKPLTKLDNPAQSHSHPHLRHIRFQNIGFDPALLVGVVEPRYKQHSIAVIEGDEVCPIQQLEFDNRLVSSRVHQYLQATVTAALSDIPGLEFGFDSAFFQPGYIPSIAPRCMA